MDKFFPVERNAESLNAECRNRTKALGGAKGPRCMRGFSRCCAVEAKSALRLCGAWGYVRATGVAFCGAVWRFVARCCALLRAGAGWDIRLSKSDARTLRVRPIIVVSGKEVKGKFGWMMIGYGMAFACQRGGGTWALGGRSGCQDIAASPANKVWCPPSRFPPSRFGASLLRHVAGDHHQRHT
jgi:hypothetical protein